jgi:hypothetical protein
MDPTSKAKHGDRESARKDTGPFPDLGNHGFQTDSFNQSFSIPTVASIALCVPNPEKALTGPVRRALDRIHAFITFIL